MVFTTLKIAVLAPMPSANTNIATTANPGLLRKTRSPYLKSWISFVIGISLLGT
jgi:uncharacterized membrane protein YdcZ (DUF606 family)